ncbi:MAG: hypothetical protein HY791_34965 [Deltaproteobacteria bacterium]|nr:hypothetical protein [Deltaproteobacteria bacterium]
MGAWLLALAVAAPDPGPFVEIRESVASVSSEGRSIQARFVLDVRNHLPFPVEAPEIEVELLSAREDERLPGWRFSERFVDVEIPPDQEASLVMERSDLAPGATPSPERIRYRVRLVRYRVAIADLALLARMVRDGDEGDQRAALASLIPPSDVRTSRIDEVRRLLSEKLAAPTPEDALVLLLAIRGAAELREPPLVPLLVALTRPSAAELWREPLADLANRMRESGRADEPRAALLPAWARRNEPPPASALDDAIVAALVDLADEAVPELVLAAEKAESDRERGLAARVLHTMGRATPRAQLDLKSREAQLRWIHVLGQLGEPERASVLAELALGRDRVIRAAAFESLTSLGPAAVGPLFDALKRSNPESKQTLLRFVEKLGEPARAALVQQAARYGVPKPPRATLAELAKEIAFHLDAVERARLETELLRGLDLLRTGEFDLGARTLDAVYASDPTLYSSRAAEIASAYLRRAETLAADGNYDVALVILETARAIHPLEEIPELTVRVRRALLEGYLELSDLARAEEIVRAFHVDGDPSARTLEARLYAKKADLAHTRGELGEARNLINRARALGPGIEEVDRVHLRLLLFENTAVLATVFLLAPMAALYAAVLIRNRMRKRASPE